MDDSSVEIFVSLITQARLKLNIIEANLFNNTFPMFVHLLFQVDDKVLMQAIAGEFEFVNGLVTDRDAYSVSHAAARTVIQTFPGLQLLPSYAHDESLAIVDWSSLPQTRIDWDGDDFTISRNPWLYVWSHFFNKTPLWNNDEATNFYYIIDITNEDATSIIQTSPKDQYTFLDLKNEQLTQNVKQLIAQAELIEVLQQRTYLQFDRTIAYLSFKEAEVHQFKQSRPFLDTYTIYNGIFRRRKERWIQFKAAMGELPGKEILETTSTIIMPGSGASAYDQKEWIHNLQAFILGTYASYPQVRFLGICFGMQITVKTFGGTVQPLEGRRLSKTFYLSGNAKIRLNDSIRAVKAFEAMQLPNEMVINKAHGDEVTEYPEMFSNLAESDLCKNEMLVSQDQRILVMQSHPEFSSTYQRVFCTQINSIVQSRPMSEFLEDPAFNSKWTLYADSLGRQLCRQFIQY